MTQAGVAANEARALRARSHVALVSQNGQSENVILWLGVRLTNHSAIAEICKSQYGPTNMKQYTPKVCAVSQCVFSVKELLV